MLTVTELLSHALFSDHRLTMTTDTKARLPAGELGFDLEKGKETKIEGYQQTKGTQVFN